MEIEYADLSVVGHREENQDRVAVAAGDHAALLIAVDGMGGHSGGAAAAEAARESLLASFWQQSHPLLDPLGFLHLAIGRAHDEVVALGVDIAPEARPRATCAICLVQGSAAYWAHVGDSRVYLIRNGETKKRTRDHSHVEQLLRDGAISEAEVHGHPMRNYVECCLGGDPILPEMTVASRLPLRGGDLLMVCTDGLWANLSDVEMGIAWRGTPRLRDTVQELCKVAVVRAAPHSDNTSVAALRFVR